MNKFSIIKPLDNIKVIDYLLNKYNYQICINDQIIKFNKNFRTNNLYFKYLIYAEYNDIEIYFEENIYNLITYKNEFIQKENIIELQIFLLHYKEILEKNNLQKCKDLDILYNRLKDKIKYYLNNDSEFNPYFYENLTEEDFNLIIKISEFYQDKLFIYLFIAKNKNDDKLYDLYKPDDGLYDIYKNTNISYIPLIYYYNKNKKFSKDCINKLFLNIDYNNCVLIYDVYLNKEYFNNLINLNKFKNYCETDFIKTCKYILNCFNTIYYPKNIQIYHNNDYLKINKINDKIVIIELNYNNQLLKFPLIERIKSGFIYIPDINNIDKHTTYDDLNNAFKINKNHYFNCYKHLYNGYNIITRIGDLFYKNYLTYSEFIKY